jgi:FemAB family protein
METQLRQVIRDIFQESTVEPNLWQTVLDQCNTIPSIFHLFNTTQFYIACFSQSNAVNLSIILYNNKQAVGVMPLMTHQDEQKKWILSSNGVEIVEPIFIKGLPRKIKKRLESQLSDLIVALSNVLNIKQCQFVNMEYNQLSSWYLLWADRAKEIFSTHHLLVDLSLPMDEIRSKFRKSLNPLINKGLREWKVEIHEHVSEELFEKFRLLHKEVAGRSTRPIKSWRAQKKQIDLLESFLITVSDKNEKLVGAGLFIYSDYQSLYCVGAYKRELFNKPIGHPVQMKAIEFLKQKRCRWYEIGQKHLKVDKDPPTDKEISISFFKEGFSTNIIARQHLLVAMKRGKYDV